MHLFLLIALLLLPASLSAQRVRLEGSVEHRAARLLSEIVDRGDYRLLDRDTVLPADFRASGDLLVIGAEVRLDGEVAGSVAVVGGELFVRPDARVGGEIAALASPVYRAGRNAVREVVELPPNTGIEVEANGEGYTIRVAATPGAPRVRPLGPAGVAIPTYDRVNGLTLRVGGSLALSADSASPLIRASAAYHTARGEPGGTVALDLPAGREVRVVAQAGRGWVTNERWIRGDLVNSVAALAAGSDIRDYHRSDAVALGVERRPRMPPIPGEGAFSPRLELRASRDRSLRASNPWTLFGDEPWRENPAIDEGTLVSATAGSGYEWKGRSTAFLGDVALEWAPPGAGDFDFAQLVASGAWTMEALWRHAITVGGYTRFNLGADPAPRQRWSFVGGSGTLPTLDDAAMRGDRVLLVESRYAIPLARPAVRFLGSPSLLVEHAVGSAWVTGGEVPRWEQNLGAGVRFSFLKALVWVNPASGLSDPHWSLSGTVPF